MNTNTMNFRSGIMKTRYVFLCDFCVPTLVLCVKTAEILEVACDMFSIYTCLFFSFTNNNQISWPIYLPLSLPVKNDRFISVLQWFLTKFFITEHSFHLSFKFYFYSLGSCSRINIYSIYVIYTLYCLSPWYTRPSTIVFLLLLSWSFFFYLFYYPFCLVIGSIFNYQRIVITLYCLHSYFDSISYRWVRSSCICLLLLEYISPNMIPFILIWEIEN